MGRIKMVSDIKNDNAVLATDPYCATCPTGTQCGKLQAALEIYESKIKHKPVEGWRDFCRLLSLELKLIKHKWKYPNACKRCELADKPSAVNKFTNKVIKYLNSKN